MRTFKRILFADSGTTPGQGGWQISRGAFEGLKKLGVEARLFPLSERLDHARRAFGGEPGISDAGLIEWASGALAEEALLFRPDLLVAMKGTRIARRTLAAVRAAGVRVAVWTMDDPYELERYLAWSDNFDVVFTNEPRCLRVYASCGARAHLLAHAHDPAVHRPDPAAPSSPHYASDVCFIGAAYPERVRLIRAAAPLLGKVRIVLIGNWGAYRRELPGIRILDGFLPEAEAARFYSGAKIVLNIHRSPDEQAGDCFDHAAMGADGVNSRTFEIAGCGAFQLVDAGRGELGKHFDAGRELDTFSGPEELASKLSRWLAADEARRSVAAAARRRALAEHTYAHRMECLLEAAAESPAPAGA